LEDREGNMRDENQVCLTDICCQCGRPLHEGDGRYMRVRGNEWVSCCLDCHCVMPQPDFVPLALAGNSKSENIRIR